MTAPEQASLSVLLCGAWDDGDGYPRTAALRQGLERAGHEVRECRVPGLGRSKHRLLRQPWRWPAALLRAARDRRRLLAALRRAQAERRPDCIVVPYPGHRLVAAVKANAAAPVVLDLFLSAYDTVVEDRRLCEPGSLGAWWLQRLDRAACAAADLVLVDTPCNAAYVAALTGLPPERFAWLPLSDPHAAAPVPHAPVAEVGDGGALRVLFFGTGVPLHGLDVLIDACVDGPVHLTLVGGTAADRGHARAALGDRVTLAPEFVDRHRLAELLAQCDLVAGVFGASGKAHRVVPWKLVIALAAGRPVITADTPAVSAWLDGSGAVVGAPAGDAMALAAELRALHRDRAALAAATAAARPAYDRHFASDRAALRWPSLFEQAGVTPSGVDAVEVSA